MAILLGLAGAEHAYFGQKDAQQLLVIRRMAVDLGIATEIVACPIVREPDGLAMSSRNVRLTREQRAAAPVLRRSLLAARARPTKAGERDAEVLRAAMRDVLAGGAAGGTGIRELRRSGHSPGAGAGRRPGPAVAWPCVSAASA